MQTFAYLLKKTTAFVLELFGALKSKNKIVKYV